MRPRITNNLVSGYRRNDISSSLSLHPPQSTRSFIFTLKKRTKENREKNADDLNKRVEIRKSGGSQKGSRGRAAVNSGPVAGIRNVARQVRVLERLTAGRNPYVPAGNTCNILPPCISPTLAPSLSPYPASLFVPPRLHTFMRAESHTER